MLASISKTSNAVPTTQASSSPPFLDLRLRERRFLPPFFALRLAERRAAFLLPPFLADAFLRDERLLGAMVQSTGDYEWETTSANYTIGRCQQKRHRKKINHEEEHANN
jgi:hypothetical protein